MEFLKEKQARNMAVFLLIFCALLLCLGWMSFRIHSEGIKQVYLNREQAIASSLLEQKTDPETIALAFQNTEITAEGVSFLNKIGHTSQTPFWLFSVLKEEQAEYAGKVFGGVLILSAVLLTGFLIDMRKREALYQKAVKVIRQFAEGNFTEHLPGNREGSLYQLLASADGLAMALQAKGEEEKRAKEFLKDTISDISHQLKTPLSALFLYMEIIQSEPENKDTMIRFIQKSTEALGRMEHLILTLLKVMRLDTGCIVFEKRCWNVEKLIREASRELVIRAKKEGKQILLEGDRMETIICDWDWTCEVIGNLIKNGLDHTGTGETVKVRWERSPMMMRIIISDNGNGIAPEDIHHVFKRFYRSKSSSDIQGIGLGLSLAKAVAEGQGGTIAVESTWGVGTSFIVSFPTEM